MYKVLLLPGDGIGPEIMAQAVKVLDKYSDIVSYQSADIGGIAIDNHDTPYPRRTAELARESDAILLGSVGGHKWDKLAMADRPEKGLLKIRQDLKLYANLRPCDIWQPLMEFSPLKEHLLKNVSLVVVRELVGGIYFGEPRGRENNRAWNTLVYSKEEIIRIARQAFIVARQRNKKLCSVDKANVLESMGLWRDTVNEVKSEFPDVELTHMYVDNAAMQLVTNPGEFDVLLTPNMFGDILSDAAAVLTGSLGMLPSASLGDEYGLYEPIHGSAPNIAGQNIANPIAIILSLAMMFELSFKRSDIATNIRNAVKKTLEDGYRTKDIYSDGMKSVTTDNMGSQIVSRL